MKEWLYILPGIAGSQLGQGLTIEKAAQNIIWVNKFKLAICHYNRLAIKPGEINPAIRPVNLYREIYGALIETMRKFALTHKEGGARRFHDVVTAPYDWRLSIMENGRYLAALIDQQWKKTPGNKATLVCHSMGGLVARAAYRYLVDEFKGEYVRRIITLGTPHLGSYGVCQTFAGNDEHIESLATAKNLIYGRFDLIFGGAAPIDRVIRVTATWPGLYELMMRYNWSPDEDPQNPEAYKASNYHPKAEIQQRLLDHSKDVWWPWITDKLYWPSPDVMRVIVGNGVSTPVAIRDPKLIGTSNRAFKFGDGDGTVQIYSAIFPQAELKGQTYVACKHSYLPRDRRVLEVLPAMILEQNEQPEPVDIKGQLQPSQRSPVDNKSPGTSTPNESNPLGEFPWLVCN